MDLPIAPAPDDAERDVVLFVLQARHGLVEGAAIYHGAGYPTASVSHRRAFSEATIASLVLHMTMPFELPVDEVERARSALRGSTAEERAKFERIAWAAYEAAVAAEETLRHKLEEVTRERIAARKTLDAIMLERNARELHHGG